MAIDDKIIDEKLQYDYSEAVKMSAISLGKIDKYILQAKKYCHLIKIE